LQKNPTDPATRSARAIAYRLVGLQALVVIAIALGWEISGSTAAFSALLGGAACVLPSFFFARYLFSTTSARAAKKIIKAFFLGELVKLAFSAMLLVLILLFIPVSMVPLIVGFAGAQFGFWLAPAFVKLDAVKVSQ
jgi:ATP synthase protein I